MPDRAQSDLNEQSQSDTRGKRIRWPRVAALVLLAASGYLTYVAVDLVIHRLLPPK